MLVNFLADFRQFENNFVRNFLFGHATGSNLYFLHAPRSPHFHNFLVSDSFGGDFSGRAADLKVIWRHHALDNVVAQAPD